MVRKIIVLCCCCLVLITALCGTVQAATHSVYENGNLSTTYITYFKDIISGIGFNDNYVAFRNGQYSYIMVVGDLDYNNGVISLNGQGKSYVFSTESSNYNSQYKYNVTDISSFSVNTGDAIIYSDIGDFPQLIERGDKYAIFTAFLLCIACICVIINRILFFRKR